MMDWRFEEPWLLLAVLPVLAAAWAVFVVVEPRRSSLTYPSAGLLARFQEPGTRVWRLLPAAAQVAAALLCAVALARPQRVERDLSSPASGIDIMLALDTSPSMAALDFDLRVDGKVLQDRMAVAKHMAARFVEGRANDRIGLTVFGGAPLLSCPLTLDYEPLVELIASVETGMTKVDGTAIGDGLATAVNHLKTSAAKSRVIVLLTDGANNAGVVDPVTAAKAAASLGIKVYAIGTGKKGESMIPVDTPFGRSFTRITDELDEETLARVAVETGGRAFRATSAKELAAVFAEIDLLEKTQVKRPEVVSFVDLYALLVIPAAGLLAVEAVLSRTLLMRVP